MTIQLNLTHQQDEVVRDVSVLEGAQDEAAKAP